MSDPKQALLDRLVAIQKIASLGYAAKTASDLEGALVATFAELLNAPGAWLLVHRGEAFEVVAHAGVEPEKIEARVDSGCRAGRAVLQSLRQNLINVIRRPEAFLSPEWVSEQRIGKVLLVPLVEDEQLGVICVPVVRWSRLPDDTFLEGIQREGARVLQRVRMVERAIASAAVHHRSAQRANDLVQFARAIDVNGVELLLDRAIEQLPRIFSAGLVSIFLYDREQDRLVLAREYNHHFETGVEVRFGSSSKDSLMAAAIAHGQPWLIHNVQKLFPQRPVRSKYRSSSCLIIPLKESSEEHRLIGVVNLANPTTEAGFDEFDVNSATIVAELLGTKISHALLWAQLQRLAITDSLTGLYVHRYFKEALQRELLRAQRFRCALSLLMIDVDLFKQVNDLYGHPAGDAALVAIAKLLTSNIREGIDIVARYGGEEFAIILPETTKYNAREVANRIRRNVENSPIIYYLPGQEEKALEGELSQGATSAHLTVTVGIASFPQDAKSASRLVYLADKALYRGKALGGNTVVLA